MRRETVVAGLLAATIVVAALIFGIRRADHIAPGSAAGSNVLLVTIDTLRADRLGAYGNRTGLTPTLDRLAETGVRYDAAFTPAPLTLPAHTSILTGLEPFAHGVRNNTGFRLGKTPTLATLLKAAGYRTGAFVGSFVLNSTFGLNRDFDVYDDRVGGKADVAGIRVAERRADRVVQSATEWILRGGANPAAPPDAAAREPQRWFAWIHLYDPHAPYQPPPEYSSGRSPYDGEVAYADAMLGRGLDALRAAGQLDRTIVIAVADHGESLGEHGEATHGLFAYDATLRVPMIVHGPGLRPRVVRTPVTNVDLMPTVLDLLGIAAPPGLDGRSLLQAEDDSARRSRALYFEALDANLTRGWAPLAGVMVDGWKYIDLPIPELYDLGHDPREVRNLAANNAERSRVLQARLKDLASSRRAEPEAVRAELDGETSRRLASLGYVGGAEPPTGKQLFSAADDPKNLVGLNEAFYTAINQQIEGHSDAALATLGDVVRQRPDFLAARITAATILASNGDSTRAIALVQSAPGAANSAAAQTVLGLAFENAGDLPAAAKCLERAAHLRPGDAETLSSLGIVYARSGRFDDGRRIFREILATDPHAAEVWNNLGILELNAGDRRASADAFRHAVAVDPNYAAAWRGLGGALAATDAAGATDAWRRALAINPADFETLFTLGVVLSEGPQPREALPYLQQFIAKAPTDRYGRNIARAEAIVRRLGTR